MVCIDVCGIFGWIGVDDEDFGVVGIRYDYIFCFDSYFDIVVFWLVFKVVWCNFIGCNKFK